MPSSSCSSPLAAAPAATPALSVELFAAGSTAPSLLEADALKASVLRMIDRQLTTFDVHGCKCKDLDVWDMVWCVAAKRPSDKWL